MGDRSMVLQPSSLVAEKRELRRSMGVQRKALSGAERAWRSQQAAVRLLALPELIGAATVAGFWALPEEIDPAPALSAFRDRGGQVALPRMSSGFPRLRFHRLGEPRELRPGPHGILEPDPSSPEVALGEIDLYLVPGLAFDGRGGRLGHGGGYYDELAGMARRAGPAPLIGLAFDFQLVDCCPADERDAALDVVVTDARVVRCRAGEGLP
jgi:5-formyltetrahydrofolate cyclo-ligase